MKQLTKICWHLICSPHPPQTSQVGLNLALGLVTSCCSVKLHDGDLHAVGWGEGPRSLVTPVKAIRVRVGLKKP